MLISFIIWIVLGTVIGMIATKFVDTRGDSPILGIAAAVGGAVVLGILYRLVSGDVERWSILALILAAVGAAAGAAVFHVIRSRTISRGRQTVRSSY